MYKSRVIITLGHYVLKILFFVVAREVRPRRTARTSSRIYKRTITYDNNCIKRNALTNRAPFVLAVCVSRLSQRSTQYLLQNVRFKYTNHILLRFSRPVVVFRFVPRDFIEFFFSCPFLVKAISKLLAFRLQRKPLESRRTKW